MKLKLGFMKSQEIAEWFGISYGTYRNSKKKKLEELSAFAEFEEVRGGLEIKNIFEDEYIKVSDKKKQFVEDKLLEQWENQDGELINTGTNVAKSFLKEYPDLGYKESSLVKIVRDTRMKNFGDGKKNGLQGSCKMDWNKAVPIQGQKGMYVCMRLTPEEIEKKNKLLQKYYATKSPEEVERKMLIKDMYDSGYYTAEDTVEALFEADKLTQDTWEKFLLDFKAQIGGMLIRTTELYVGKYLDKGEILEIEEGNKVNFK